MGGVTGKIQACNTSLLKASENPCQEQVSALEPSREPPVGEWRAGWERQRGQARSMGSVEVTLRGTRGIFRLGLAHPTVVSHWLRAALMAMNSWHLCSWQVLAMGLRSQAKPGREQGPCSEMM